MPHDAFKEGGEINALCLAVHSKIRFGKDAEEIIGWLNCESSKMLELEPPKVPDFVLIGQSGVVGVEHFLVEAGSYIDKNGNCQAPITAMARVLDSAVKRNARGAEENKNWFEYVKENGELNSNKTMEYLNWVNNTIKDSGRNDKEVDKMSQRIEKSASDRTYTSSMEVFKYHFENHLKKVDNYRQRHIQYGNIRIVFLIEMRSWHFEGLVAVGKEIFECRNDRVPLCKDLVDIVASANEIDAVVILFNLFPFNEPIVFAFTPQQAKNMDIGVEVYEYAGRSGVYMTEDDYKKAIKLMKSQTPCVVETLRYD